MPGVGVGDRPLLRSEFQRFSKDLEQRLSNLAVASGPSAGGGGGGGAVMTAHTVLSAKHTDSVAAAVVQGDILTVQGAAPPLWSRLAVGAAQAYLRSDGTDPAWSALLDADMPLQYLALPGRVGGQAAYGGTADGDDLTLYTTSHANKGNYFLPDQAAAYLGTTVVNAARTWASLTIDAVSADREAAVFRASGDVAHGMTDLIETTAYGKIWTPGNQVECLWLSGYGVSYWGFGIDAMYTTGTSEETQNSFAPIQFEVFKKSGTGRGNVAATDNLCAFKRYITNAEKTCWLLDCGGNTWQVGRAMIPGGLYGGSELSGNINFYTTTAVSKGDYLFNDATRLMLNETADVFVTVGQVINQGAAVNFITAWHGSDVVHGMTTLADNNCFGGIKKCAGAQGGVGIYGYSEGEIAGVLGVFYTTDNTTKTSAASAPICLQISKKNGTGRQTPGADANLVAIQKWDGAAYSTVALWDVEGDSWQPGTVQCGGLRIDQVPAAGAITPDKYITISCSGVDYKVPVLAV